MEIHDDLLDNSDHSEEEEVLDSSNSEYEPDLPKKSEKKSDTKKPKKEKSGKIKKEPNYNSVKTLFVLCIFSLIKESYKNMKAIFDAMNIGAANFYENRNAYFSCDFKMQNIVLGLGSHASSHPCSYCNKHKDHFNCKKKNCK